MSKIKGLFWLCASFIGLCMALAILQVLCYYAIASFSDPEPSLAHTAKDLVLAMDLQSMQLNVKAFLYISLIICGLDLLLWIFMKRPEPLKQAYIIGLNSGIIISLIILVRLSVLLTRYSRAIFISGLVIGLIFSLVMTWSSVKLHMARHQRIREFELGFIFGILVLLTLTFLRLSVFAQYRPETTRLTLIFSLSIMAVAVIINRIRHYALLYGGFGPVLLDKLIVVSLLAAGIFFSSGSVKRYKLVSRTLSRTESFHRAGLAGRNLQAMPNVILIVWDTVRRDHLSLYNYERKTTPFLDGMAADAVVFERAYSIAPNTVPSHAGIFTGLYSSQNNCHYENPRLAPDLTTLAEMMRERGYLTLGITNNPALNHFNGFSQGFDLYKINYEFGNFTGDTIYLAFVDFFFPESRRDSGATETRRIYQNWLWAAKKTGQPFFL